MISKTLGIKLENVTLDVLGKARRIRIDRDNTAIIDGLGKKKEIEARVRQIKQQIEATTSDYDRGKLQERLAKMAGGVAVIRVGGATEVEVKERKDCVDDAMHATNAAVEEGSVAGGGSALLFAAKALDRLNTAQRRSKSRRGNRAQGDREPCTPNRREFLRGRIDCRWPATREERGELGLRCSNRRIQGHAIGWHYRPHQGRTHRVAGCGIDVW